MGIFDVHPATRMVAWFLLLLAVQGLRGASLAVACLLLPILGARILRRGSRLLWRARWLLLSLLVIFSWGVSGEPLWDAPVAPTQEGLREALTHLGRLALLLTGVAAFLELVPLSELLAGAHVLLGPLRRLGFDPDRGVVRLMLVLRYVENLPRPSDWRTLLDVPAAICCEALAVGRRPLRWTDRAAMLTATATVLWFISR